jgi:hypothetical protein
MKTECFLLSSHFLQTRIRRSERCLCLFMILSSKQYFDDDYMANNRIINE